MKSQMDSGLTGKTVLLTGAASGIGRAAAELLAAEGAHVLAVDRDGGGLEELGRLMPEVEPVVGDLADEHGIEQIVREVVARRERLDILVNNAGLGFVGDLVSTSTQQWDETFAVNVRAPFLLCRAVIPHMLERDGGVIVNVSSAAALSAVGNRAAYIASKGAVLALTRSITVDFGARGIRANAVAPGTVDTPWIDRMTSLQPDPAAAHSDMEQRQLIGRLAYPREVADAIVYLASDRAAFQHGSTLVVDGGFTAR
ncbi:MAG TPA: SDR family oxidoreductase [Brevibacterium sp.]|nr:SDR family oxidoreductase [Brevibacterium sp.]